MWQDVAPGVPIEAGKLAMFNGLLKFDSLEGLLKSSGLSDLRRYRMLL